MTESDAASWMLKEYEEFGFLYQESAAIHLAHFNDERLTYYDKNSNLCLSAAVLKIFNELTPHAVYERSGKFWRKRLTTDQPGRQQ